MGRSCHTYRGNRDSESRKYSSGIKLLPGEFSDEQIKKALRIRVLANRERGFFQKGSELEAEICKEAGIILETEKPVKKTHDLLKNSAIGLAAYGLAYTANIVYSSIYSNNPELGDFGSFVGLAAGFLFLKGIGSLFARNINQQEDSSSEISEKPRFLDGSDF